MKRSAAVFALALACSVATSASAQNIVTNPGFETGNFSGWTQFGNTGFTGVGAGTGVGGTYSAFFGPVGSTGGIFQSLATTPGQTYTFSWWVSLDGGAPGSFDAWWDGGSVFSVSNGSTAGFVQQTFDVVATGASTDMRFFFRDDPGFENLDDVSVVASGENLAVTPEPATMTLLATGLVGMAGAARRRRKASAE